MRAGWRSPAGVLVIAIAAIAVAAGATSALAARHATTSGGSAASYDVAPQDTVHLVASNAQFSPADANVKAGRLTEIVVDNQDAVFHTFTYDLAGKTYSHDVLGSSPTRVLVQFDQPGDVSYRCLVHPGMTGTLHVI